MKSKGHGQLNGFLDRGSHVEGKLHFEDTFRVDGKVTGRVESTGDLYIGEGGTVEGEIAVGRLFVSGTADAAIEAAARVEIAPGGRVRGEIVSPCLVIEEGAFFEGQSRMIERVKPQGTVAVLRREDG